MNITIISNKDIDLLIFNMLNIDGLRKIAQVNKHYNCIVKKQLENFYIFFNYAKYAKSGPIKKINKGILKYALNMKDIEVFKYLCSINIKPLKNWISERDSTVFILFCKTDKIEFIKYLLEIESINMFIGENDGYEKILKKGNLNIIKIIINECQKKIPEIMEDLVDIYSIKELCRYKCLNDERIELIKYMIDMNIKLDKKIKKVDIFEIIVEICKYNQNEKILIYLMNLAMELNINFDKEDISYFIKKCQNKNLSTYLETYQK